MEDNSLKNLIEIIKTGSREEVKDAQKQVERFWHNRYISRREECKKVFSIFLDEIEEFDKIQDIDHQAYFINTIKWSFWSASEESFGKWAEFILKYIQHPSGKIRQAIFHASDYLIMSVIVDLDSDNERIKDRFGSFVYAVESLLEEYDEPRFHRYEYISSMPSSIYKSLQKLLVEVLFRNEYHKGLYRKWLKSKYPKF